MPDFNHGGLKDVDDITASPFEDRINAFVDAAYQQRGVQRSEDEPRPYVGASYIGNDCSREIQLGYIDQKFGNLPESPKPFPGRIYRIFEAGHVFEDRVAEGLINAGFDLSQYKDPATKEQHGWSVMDDQYQGHVDGVISKSPVPLNLPCLWECKALNNAGTNSVLKYGLEASKPTYYTQVQVNQKHMGIKSPTLFSIVNKDTSRWHHFLIGHVAEVADAADEKAKHIIEETMAGRLLPRPWSDQMNYRCRIECERMHKLCWKLLPD